MPITISHNLPHSVRGTITLTSVLTTDAIGKLNAIAPIQNVTANEVQVPKRDLKMKLSRLENLLN